MIASLRGKLIDTDHTSAVVECGGVGFKCTVTKNTLYHLPKIGEEVFLYTFLVVREDAMELYGFENREEMEAFKLVTSVNGVGAKIGIALLSELTASQLMASIAGNDPKMLTAAPGIGIKLAQRIVLELKDKVGAFTRDSGITLSTVGNVAAGSDAKEAVAALVSLGYTQSEASLAVGRLDQTLSAQELIRQSLKLLARGI